MSFRRVRVTWHADDGYVGSRPHDFEVDVYGDEEITRDHPDIQAELESQFQNNVSPCVDEIDIEDVGEDEDDEDA